MDHIPRNICAYRLAYFVLLFVIIGQNWYAQVLANHRHEEAITGRKQLLAMEMHNEQMILDHMKRTVARWETFQQENPQLKVEHIPEPVR